MYENPNLLVVTGSYTIGKERIFMGKYSRICLEQQIIFSKKMDLKNGWLFNGVTNVMDINGK